MRLAKKQSETIKTFVDFWDIKEYKLFRYLGSYMMQFTENSKNYYVPLFLIPDLLKYNITKESIIKNFYTKSML